MLLFTILLGFLGVLLAISQEVPVCGPVCDIYCQYGNVLDENGCPTCKCNQPSKDPDSPCKRGWAPLPGYFCGHGPTYTECPPKSKCVISPVDAYAVCCPMRGRHEYNDK